MKRILLPIAVVGALAVSACTDSNGAERVLHNQGFTNISTGGYSVFGCSEDDFYATKFTATSPAGKRVSGVVCAGLFKGATIRFD